MYIVCLNLPIYIDLVKASNISSLSWDEGIPQQRDLSSLPGRSKAGSIRSGLLVAASTYTPVTRQSACEHSTIYIYNRVCAYAMANLSYIYSNKHSNMCVTKQRPNYMWVDKEIKPGESSEICTVSIQLLPLAP